MKKFALFLLFLCAFAHADGPISSNKLEITPVADVPLLTGTDLKHAELSGAGERTLVRVELEPQAAARVKAYTTSHVDGRLAILVDGEPIMAPRIRVPIGDRFEVGPFPHAEAERLASVINAK